MCGITAVLSRHAPVSEAALAAATVRRTRSFRREAAVLRAAGRRALYRVGSEGAVRHGSARGVEPRERLCRRLRASGGAHAVQGCTQRAARTLLARNAGKLSRPS